MATRSLPRRRSMTDAFNFTRNPEAANVVRNDLFNLVQEMRQRNAHLDTFARELPKLTEGDLASLGQSAEEEMALAMDSPAHPVEELGVTRLVRTCGHVFCRKELSITVDSQPPLTPLTIRLSFRSIRGWLYQGNTTCPTCRTPFLAPPPGGEGRVGEERLPEAQQASFAAFINNGPINALDVIFYDSGPNIAPAGGERESEASPDEDPEPLEAHFEYDHGREEFSGMYS
ncbi:hypothetical protein GSI_15241 [Ganoderma sinense ZZ0214-1]|uniref:RING-type domain-containing protein n=1 Tax=Ganoderma sinense ZZ0214-1 TaxID=1077348 RepID=A0A2G8RM19_9APHY|nr:hypothetical protein GSI_15241 [Ganoderma sinense ZZ0214-1]